MNSQIKNKLSHGTIVFDKELYLYDHNTDIILFYLIRNKMNNAWDVWDTKQCVKLFPSISGFGLHEIIKQLELIIYN